MANKSVNCQPCVIRIKNVKQDLIIPTPTAPSRNSYIMACLPAIKQAYNQFREVPNTKIYSCIHLSSDDVEIRQICANIGCSISDFLKINLVLLELGIIKKSPETTHK